RRRRRPRRRYAGDTPRVSGHRARPRPERGDRSPGERGDVPARRHHRHGTGRRSRGRHGVPHGRCPVAAAAGARGASRGARHGAGAARATPHMTQPARLRITGGTVYDPANGVDGVVRDVCIEGDQIVAKVPVSAPRLDARGMVVMPGNDDYLLRQLAAGEGARARDYVAWLLGTTRGYAIKIVNPGGVAVWKGGGDRRNVSGLDDTLGSSAVTPRKILDALAGAANQLKLPHPVHIHCNNLGQPGNSATTLESMNALSGQRAHFTHLQFHSYGGAPGKGWASAARAVIEYVNAHAEVSVDLGQVMFGSATTVTADSPVEHLLYASSGRKWVNVDIELESGCGIVPYSYKENAAVAALQWSVGLELFLLANDPWRVVLSTDHPNGGTFLSYPELIRLLMDRGYRDDR